MSATLVRRALAAALAAFLLAQPARADIPLKGADKDGLGLEVDAKAGDVYSLTEGKEIYHGTYKPFTAFRKLGSPDATWFGANKETSEAMGYFRWCSSAIYLAQGLSLPSGKKPTLGSDKYESLDPSGWPHLMKVKVKSGQTLHLLLVPYGKAGHLDQFKKIGYDMSKSKHEKLKVLPSLYGVGSFAGIEALKESELCTTKVWLDDKKHIVGYQKGSATAVGTQKGNAIQLEGWRAPWDQNELAVCKNAVADKLEIEKGATVTQAEATHAKLVQAFAPLKNSLGGPGDNKAIKLKDILDDAKNAKHKEAETYKTVFLSANTELCDEKAATHAGSHFADNNNSFDIVFTNKEKEHHPHGEADKNPVIDAKDEGETNNDAH